MDEMVMTRCLVKEAESHVVIFLLLRLFLLFFLLGLRGGGTSSGSSGGRGASSNSGPDLGDQLLQVAGLKGLEQVE